MRERGECDYRVAGWKTEGKIGQENRKQTVTMIKTLFWSHTLLTQFLFTLLNHFLSSHAVALPDPLISSPPHVQDLIFSFTCQTILHVY